MGKLSRVVACGTFLLALTAGHTASAANYFSWSVEGDTVPSTGQTVLNYDGNTSRSTDTAHTGSYSMKLDIRGNDSGNNGMGADLNPKINTPFDLVGSPALYYRWWMKIMPGFSWGDGTAKTKSSRVSGAVYPRGYTGYVRASGFEIKECEDVGNVQPGGGCIPRQGVSIGYDMRSKNDGIWHEYIVMVKFNTTIDSSDAQFKVWVDGNFVGEQLDFTLHNKSGNRHIEAWASWMVRPYWQLNGTTSDGGIIYVDDFSTDDTWNSLIDSADTGGAGGDTSAPVISSVASSSVGESYATITSTTNEPADFQVQYGVTTSYGQSTPVDTSLVTNHSQTITGLTANTTYHYSVKSRDASGNLATSGDEIFITLGSVSSSGGSDECTDWEVVHPEWIWCDDFESANISVSQGGYLEYDNNGGDFVPMSGTGWNNSYGMRAKWQTGEVGAGSLHLVFGRNPIGNQGIRNTEDFRNLYYRVYVRTQAGWSGDPAKFSRAIVFSNGDWSQAMIAHYWSGSANNGTLAIDPVGCVDGSGNVVCSGYNDFNNMQWLVN